MLTRLAQPPIRAVIEPWLTAGRAARAGITDLELGYSARNAEEWDAIAEAVAAFRLVETTASHVRRARQVQRLLAERSQRGRKLPDLLIAAAAEEAGMGLLHYDADFDKIAEITSQPTRWVVPRGTVD